MQYLNAIHVLPIFGATLCVEAKSILQVRWTVLSLSFLNSKLSVLVFIFNFLTDFFLTIKYKQCSIINNLLLVLIDLISVPNWRLFWIADSCSWSCVLPWRHCALDLRVPSLCAEHLLRQLNFSVVLRPSSVLEVLDNVPFRNIIFVYSSSYLWKQFIVLRILIFKCICNFATS